MSARAPRLLLVLMSAACTGSGDAPEARDAGDTDRKGEVLLSPDSLLQAAGPVEADSLMMPDLPPAESGRLVVASAGRDSLSGSWGALAHRCLEPPSLLVMSEGTDIGMALLLALPDSGPPPDSFTVRHADTLLVPGHARVAVQVFHARRPAALEGSGGTVVLDRRDGPVSGTFTASVRNMTTFDSVLVRGVFHRLPLDTLPPDFCRHDLDTTTAS